MRERSPKVIYKAGSKVFISETTEKGLIIMPEERQTTSLKMDPELWKRFRMELKNAPGPGEPHADDWTISQEVSEQFKKYHTEILEIKKQIKQRSIDAAIRDILELREIPGCEEDAKADEEDLARYGIAVTSVK
jgi:hypothetical protein